MISRLASKPRCASSKLLIIWRSAIFLSLMAFVLIQTTRWLYNTHPLARRQRTNIIFMKKDLCALSEALPDKAEIENQRTVVIVIISARNNFVNRNLIRRTYGSIKTLNNIRILAVVFMLGNFDANGVPPTDHDKLQAEMDQFGDIVVGDFVDRYENLTLKMIMTYEWITFHCREAEYVVKTDDDMLVNIVLLTKVMNSWSAADVASSNIWCQIQRNESINTNATSKYHASLKDFPTGKFPDHCAGLGYVTTIGVVDRIIEEIFTSFTGKVTESHEEVFMTGIVVARINQIQNASPPHKFKPISYVNTHGPWYSYDFHNGTGAENHFLRNLVKQTANDVGRESLDKFRQKYGKRIFYLFNHRPEFRENYLDLWRIIEKIFS